MRKLSYKVTIADIARKLNIDPATVSRALHDHPSISERTKTMVINTAEKLQYNRNNLASSLRSGRTNVIGVMVPSADISFFGSVVHGIEALANEKGYSVLIYQSNEARSYELKGLEAFLNARVDGILVSIAKDTSDYSHFTNIKKLGIPLVFFDRTKEDLAIPSVMIDDYKGAFIATEHLIKQGYKRIAHISGPQHMDIFRHRLHGYKDALKKYKMPSDKEFIYEGDISIDAGRKAIVKLLSASKSPDAVFAVEDFTALGALKQLKDYKIKVPQEFGVVGFANELFGEHITPSLSTFDQQTVQMGKQALGLLLQLIEAKGTRRKVDQKIVLDPVPVFRESSLKREET